MSKEKETKNFEEEEVIEEITNEEELLDSINAGVKGSGSIIYTVFDACIMNVDCQNRV